MGFILTLRCFIKYIQIEAIGVSVPKRSNMKKKLLLIAITFCLTANLSIKSENENWMDYWNSKWNTFANSRYVQILPYILFPGITAFIGKMIAEKKIINTNPSTWTYFTPRQNQEIIRGWTFMGGLTGLAAALATYKIISYYQKSKPKTDSKSSTDNNQ